MNEPEDLLHLLTVARQERQHYQLLKSLGYLDPSADHFGLNKWTQLLYLDRSNEEHTMQKFPLNAPKHLVSMLAIPSDFTELDLEVGSQTFREWLASLKWEYCPLLESPFRHCQPQACSEGILLPAWVNSERRSVLEKFLVIHRNGVVEFGLRKDISFHHEEEVVFKLIQVVARIWQFLGFYTDLSREFLENQAASTTYLVNIRGTRNALLSSLAEGWPDPRIGISGWYNPRCPDNHLQFSRVTEASNHAEDTEALVHWFATRIDNAWGHFEPRCYVHVSVDASQPFAHRNFARPTT
jgi:hypothetical protein